MMPPPPEACTWSTRKWVLLVAALVAGQVIAIWLLGSPTTMSRVAGSFSPTLRWAAGAPDSQKVAELPGFSDPTLFALAHLETFSGAAWLKFEPQQRGWLDWRESPIYLALKPDRLGEQVGLSAATNVFPPVLVADKPMPRFFPFNSLAGPESPPAVSDVSLLGQLARRGLASPLVPPSWPHTDLLSNTVVHVLVDGDGQVVSATTLESCGLRAADDHAQKMVVQAQFVAVGPSASLTSGKLIFLWHTRPPVPASASTNTRPGGSP